MLYIFASLQSTWTVISTRPCEVQVVVQSICVKAERAQESLRSVWSGSDQPACDGYLHCMHLDDTQAWWVMTSGSPRTSMSQNAQDR